VPCRDGGHCATLSRKPWLVCSDCRVARIHEACLGFLWLKPGVYDTRIAKERAWRAAIRPHPVNRGTGTQRLKCRRTVMDRPWEVARTLTVFRPTDIRQSASMTVKRRFVLLATL
jgi:hypothetical protein